MLKFSSFSLALLAIALFCSDVSAQEASIGSALSPPKCIEVRNFANIKDDNAVQMNDCDNSTSQIWTIFTGLTEIKLADPNLDFCIDAVDVDTSNPVVVRECSQAQEQQWIFTDDGLLMLANNTNLCLEVPNSSTKNGVQVHTSGCNGGLNQVWNLV